MEEAAATLGDQSTDTESVIIQPDLDPQATCPDEPGRREPKINLNQGEIFKALEIIERDSLAIAGSFTSLFASLRFALSEATSTSVDHMQCFGDATARLQESVLDAATKGNRYINSCMRLNEEMKDIGNLATQLKILRRNVDVLDSAVTKLLRFP
ncbi:BLOC-1-related complex [Salix suchowensis]|nr:BLOC-1-related complex [Salix suchowensis]